MDRTPRTPAINLPAVVVWLAASFAAVQLVRHFLSVEQDQWVLLAFGFMPARYGEIGPYLPGGEGALFWSPVTYAFLHGDVTHLLVNVIWMASFGGPLARRFGAVRFLLLGLVATVAGAGLHYIVFPNDQTLVIGASGGVSGMMAATTRFAFSPGGPLGGGRGAAALHVPAEPLLAVFRNGRAVAFILVWFAVNLVFGIGGSMVPGVDAPIAWQAHVGGFLAGLLIFPLLDPVGRGPQPDPRREDPEETLAS